MLLAAPSTDQAHHPLHPLHWVYTINRDYNYTQPASSVRHHNKDGVINPRKLPFRLIQPSDHGSPTNIVERRESRQIRDFRL
jgi:hypothetical protein